MKKIFFPLILLLAISACKTTEENYRSAYEVAKSKQTEGLVQEEIAGMQREEAMPKAVYKGDSIPLKAVYVRCVEGAPASDDVAPTPRALQYNVVVASFMQQFNARSVFSRLRDGGYPHPVLLEDKSGRYYVAAVTTASLDSALAVLRALPGNSPVALRSPYPYILQRP